MDLPDITSLLQAIIDQLTMLVPILGALVAAWLGRRIYMLRLVKSEAVAAEKDIGSGNGGEKHARVRERLQGTFTGRTFSLDRIDDLISTRGKDAAHQFRDSMPPPGGNGKASS